ncbi:PIN domain-like protein [Thamnidium elegans]|nr:PIN domain-like protein [Thamnidium elegans]
MGIQDLIPLLKSIQKPVKLSEYAGKAVAVDGHCWLYRSTFNCASELATRVESNAYVEYFMNLVKMLLFYKVVPVIVFDGQQLPIKRAAADARATFRSTKLDEGKALLKCGKVTEANKCFQQAISITPSMVAKIIEELDRHKIQHIVSPYEAAPQLTYMVNSGQVKAVITERSDVFAFGCSNVIFKMGHSDKRIQIAGKDVCNQITGVTNPRKLRYMCILSGCDYLPSLSGIGLQEAQDIVNECKTVKDILQVIQNRFSENIASEYNDKFIKANAAFLYQFVFDPSSRTYVRFSSLPKDIDLDYLSGLGESPQNCNIPLLKSNNAIYLDYARILREANKENIDPFVQLAPSDFSEFNLEDNALKDKKALLKKVEPRSPATPRTRPPRTEPPPRTRPPRTGPLACITNTGISVLLNSHSFMRQPCRRRRSTLADCPEPVAKVRKPFASADTSVVRQSIHKK